LPADRSHSQAGLVGAVGVALAWAARRAPRGLLGPVRRVEAVGDERGADARCEKRADDGERGQIADVDKAVPRILSPTKARMSAIVSST
jgi:hypothetical protein